MTRRFYVTPGTLESEQVVLPPHLAQRIAKVLRMRTGDQISLFDGVGEALVRLDDVSGSHVSGTIVEHIEPPPEPHIRLHLYQSITKGERFEWLLEKGTELGVARFVPLHTSRAVVKTAAEGNRSDRWGRIVVEAAEQCGRGAVPAVDAPQQYADALASAPGVLLLPYEEAGEGEPNIRAALDGAIDALFALGNVSVFIGPEGGFDPDEVEGARDAGAAIVTMGSRVLRSETAGLVAATLVMQAVGELG